MHSVPLPTRSLSRTPVLCQHLANLWAPGTSISVILNRCFGKDWRGRNCSIVKRTRKKRGQAGGHSWFQAHVQINPHSPILPLSCKRCTVCLLSGASVGPSRWMWLRVREGAPQAGALATSLGTPPNPPPPAPSTSPRLAQDPRKLKMQTGYKYGTEKFCLDLALNELMEGTGGH